MKERTWVILLVLSIALIIVGAVLAFHTREGVVRVVPVPTTALTFPYRVPGSIVGAIGGVLLVITAYHFFRRVG